MATMSFDFLQSILTQTKIMGVDWLIPTSISAILIFAICREDLEQIKSTMFPMIFGLHSIGLTQNFVVMLVSGIVYVQDSMSLQVLGEALNYTGKWISGERKNEIKDELTEMRARKLSWLTARDAVNDYAPDRKMRKDKKLIEGMNIARERKNIIRQQGKDEIKEMEFTMQREDVLKKYNTWQKKQETQKKKREKQQEKELMTERKKYWEQDISKIVNNPKSPSTGWKSGVYWTRQPNSVSDINTMLKRLEEEQRKKKKGLFR